MKFTSGFLCGIKQGNPFFLVDAAGNRVDHLTYITHDDIGVTYSLISEKAEFRIEMRPWRFISMVGRNQPGDHSHLAQSGSSK